MTNNLPTVPFGPASCELGPNRARSFHKARDRFTERPIMCGKNERCIFPPRMCLSLPGTRLGAYEILSLLGSGGMGRCLELAIAAWAVTSPSNPPRSRPTGHSLDGLTSGVSSDALSRQVAPHRSWCHVSDPDPAIYVGSATATRTTLTVQPIPSRPHPCGLVSRRAGPKSCPFQSRRTMKVANREGSGCCLGIMRHSTVQLGPRFRHPPRRVRDSVAARQRRHGGGVSGTR
jgi:hypothetical protein